jgi:hypothetical protein
MEWGLWKLCKTRSKNNASPCDTENMIFVIRPTERLENDEYGVEYYKLIKNAISVVFYDEKSPLNYSESIFSESTGNGGEG